MALSTRGHSPGSRDPSHSNGKVNVARKVVSSEISRDVMRQVSRFAARMPTLHVGLLEYTWELIGEGPGRYKVKENGAKDLHSIFVLT